MHIMSTGHYEMPRLAGPTSSSGGAAVFSVHTVLIAVRCWWHIALPLGLLLAAAAAVVVYYVSAPTYTGSASGGGDTLNWNFNGAAGPGVAGPVVRGSP